MSWVHNPSSPERPEIAHARRRVASTVEAEAKRLAQAVPEVPPAALAYHFIEASREAALAGLGLLEDE